MAKAQQASHMAKEAKPNQLLSLVLAIVLTVGLMPAMPSIAFGAESSVTVGNLTLTGDGIAEGTDYSYAEGVLTILSNKAMTISGTSSSDRIVVGDVDANLTLNGVTIESSESDVAALTLSEAITTTLTLVGAENYLNGDGGGIIAGDAVAATLIVQGDGSLGKDIDNTTGKISLPAGNLVVKGGQVVSDGGYYAFNSLEVQGGSLSITAYGVTSNFVQVAGGVLACDVGIVTPDGKVTVNGNGSFNGLAQTSADDSPLTVYGNFDLSSMIMGSEIIGGTKYGVLGLLSPLIIATGSNVVIPQYYEDFYGANLPVYVQSLVPITIENGATLSNQGVLSINPSSDQSPLRSVLTIEAGGQFTNAPEGSLLLPYVDPGMGGSVNGAIDNSGTLTNEGVLVNTVGAITNNGVIINTNEVTNEVGGTIAMGGGATFTNAFDASLTNKGTIDGSIDNAGNVYNTGTITGEVTGVPAAGVQLTDADGGSVAGSTVPMHMPVDGVNDTLQLSAQAVGLKDASAVTWAIDNGTSTTPMASISDDGLVTALSVYQGSQGAGTKNTATVTASVEAGGVTYTASCEIDVKPVTTVVLKTPVGSEIATLQGAQGYALDEPDKTAIEASTGLKFDADPATPDWYRNDQTTSGEDVAWDFSAPLTLNNWTVYARLLATVSFDAQGGSPHPVDQSILQGKAASTPEEPTRDGFRFDGWFTEATGESAWNFSSAINANRTLYAHWTQLDGHTVTYDTQGGSTVYAGATGIDGTVLTVPADPTKTGGWSFAGWYDAADGGNKVDLYAEVFDSDTTLYAHWDPAVEFVANNGTENQTVARGAENKVTAPADPSKENLAFAGWFTDDGTFANPWTSGSVVDANTVVYAKWTAAVTFDAKGGSAVDAQTVQEGKGIGSYTAPTKANLAFAGWYKDAELTESYLAADADVSTAPAIAGNTTLFAKWTAEVTYDKNSTDSVDGMPDAASVDEGATIAEAPAAPTRAGYVFDGWFTETACTTPFVFAEDDTATPVAVDTTLYAKWTQAFNVTFDAAGGSAVAPDALATQVVRTGEQATAPVVERAGYEFLGWFVGDTDTAFDFSTPITANTALTAHWKDSSVWTVAFDAMDGTPPLKQAVTKDTPIAAPEDPTRDAGYTFKGWYTAETGGSAWNFTDNVTGDMTLYARWTVETKFIDSKDASGAPISTVQTDYRTAVTRPSGDPVKAGYTFAGWYSDSTCTVSYDFTKPITRSVSIYAGWTENRPASVEITGTNSVDAGSEAQLTATVKAGGDKTLLDKYNVVTWTSSDETVATISDEGVVTGVKAGTATITATVAQWTGVSKTLEVTVTVPAPQSVEVTPNAKSLKVGDEVTLSAAVSPSQAPQGVTWSSDATDVATVDSSTGAVKAVKAGTATITATSTEDGSVTGTSTISVVEEPVTGITLDKADHTFVLDGDAGEADITLTATVAPSDATNKNVTWKSSDEAVATVADGVVKCVGVGTATITAASAADSTIAATCEITVKKPDATSVTVTPKTQEIVLGTTAQPVQLTATVAPDKADQAVTWESSNSLIASVDENGQVTGLRVGTAIITAKTVVGKVAGGCTVTVKRPVPTGVSLSETVKLAKIGTNFTLNATIEPAEADQSVTWKSSDENIATVSAGTVTALAPGEVTITATSVADPTFSATCTVTVSHPDAIKIDGLQPTLSLEVGTSQQVLASIIPAGAAQEIIWETSDATIATVANGRISALAKGTATITAKAASNPNIQATTTVTVTKTTPDVVLVESVTLDQPKLSLKVGASAKLAATVNPADATDNTVAWTTSDFKVAGIAADGTVKAVKAGTATITATAGGKTATCEVTVTSAEASSRLGGDNRYETMTLVSKTAFPEDGSCPTVVIARGDNFPDALAAAGLAGVNGGQVLLTETSALTAETKAEIKRLGATRAYVIGDEYSITTRTFNEIKSLVGSAERLGGADRAETALKIYKAGGNKWGKTAIVATGGKAADSLSVSPIAYALNAPIFLADSDGNLSAASLDAIAKGGFTNVIVLGDEYSVSKATFDKLKKAAGSAVRIGGADRYETSRLTAEFAFGHDFTCGSVALTAGREGKFADALVASSLGGRNMSPLLLVDDGSTVCIDKVLAAHKDEASSVYVLGDKYTVSDAVNRAIQKALL